MSIHCHCRYDVTGSAGLSTVRKEMIFCDEERNVYRLYQLHAEGNTQWLVYSDVSDLARFFLGIYGTTKGQLISDLCNREVVKMDTIEHVYEVVDDDGRMCVVRASSFPDIDALRLMGINYNIKEVISFDEWLQICDRLQPDTSLDADEKEPVRIYQSTDLIPDMGEGEDGPVAVRTYRIVDNHIHRECDVMVTMFRNVVNGCFDSACSFTVRTPESETVYICEYPRIKFRCGRQVKYNVLFYLGLE
jgi:hypothetical protein